MAVPSIRSAVSLQSTAMFPRCRQHALLSPACPLQMHTSLLFLRQLEPALGRASPFWTFHTAHSRSLVDTLIAGCHANHALTLHGDVSSLLINLCTHSITSRISYLLLLCSCACFLRICLLMATTVPWVSLMVYADPLLDCSPSSDRSQTGRKTIDAFPLPDCET